MHPDFYAAEIHRDSSSYIGCIVQSKPALPIRTSYFCLGSSVLTSPPVAPLCHVFSSCRSAERRCVLSPGGSSSELQSAEQISTCHWTVRDCEQQFVCFRKRQKSSGSANADHINARSAAIRCNVEQKASETLAVPAAHKNTKRWPEEKPAQTHQKQKRTGP